MYESETSKSLTPEQLTVVYQPGTVVRVTQQIPRRLDTYTTTVTGTVVRQERQKSGSWYASNKRGKVWLDRLIVQKTDGEISILNLDAYTKVDVLQGPEATRAESPMVETRTDMTAGVT
jgi:hypothetical protein